MQHNIYYPKVHALVFRNYLNQSNRATINYTKQPLELEILLKRNPFRLDLVRLQLDVLYMEELGNVSKLLKEIVFLFNYTTIYKHHWIIDENGNTQNSLNDFLQFSEDILFDFLVDIEQSKKLKKYERIVSTYLTNTYYHFYIKGLLAKKELNFKQAYLYFKKSYKLRGYQENILIQIQYICQKLNKTKELKKYMHQYENLMF